LCALSSLHRAVLKAQLFENPVFGLYKQQIRTLLSEDS
jgi:hypothetical protein